MIPVSCYRTAAIAFVVLTFVSSPSVPAAATQVRCPQPPDPVRAINLQGYYKDAAKSVVDRAAAARKRATVKPLKSYLNAVTRLADRAITARPALRREGYGQCAIFWLRAWAEGGAYLGVMGSKQAKAQRKWDLAGLALAYLKVRRYAGPVDRSVVDPWLQEIADRARAVYKSPGKIRNNHWYWLGLGLGAVGLATGSERHWNEARTIMQDAAHEVRSDGFLPEELKRGKRALHYHAFSLMPLVTLAELASAKGEDWYKLNSNSLHRLVQKTTLSLKNPVEIERIVGVSQERPLRTRAGWVQLYKSRFTDRRLPVDLPASKPYHRWLGGHVLALRRALSDLASSN